MLLELSFTSCNELVCPVSIHFAGGRFFAKQMRAANYVTMLDPFQEKFGNRMGGIIFLSAITGELLWCAAILAALGKHIYIYIYIYIYYLREFPHCKLARVVYASQCLFEPGKWQNNAPLLGDLCILLML